MRSGSISACVIVRNEEAVIDRCLASLDGVVDEIILVHDGPCEDRTLEIAERYDARIFVRPLLGNPEAQTVFAYDQARGEWLLNVDADEYLSDELKGNIRALAAREDVNGYRFLWRIWDGERYITRDGPFKLVLQRREATHMLGMAESLERVDGQVEISRLSLEHKPLYNNFTPRVMLTKWRKRAQAHARDLTSAFSELPKFNWNGPWDWPWWRRPLNRLAPVVLPVYLAAIFVKFLREGYGQHSALENLRSSFFQTCYAALVQFYVIREVYGPRRRPRP